MSRTIRILLFAVLLILIFWLFSGLFKRINKSKKTIDEMSQEEQLNSVEEGVKDIADEFFESGETLDDNTVNNISPGEKESKQDKQKPSNLEDELFKETSIDQATPSTSNNAYDRQTKPDRSELQSNYIVIAGNYLIRSNAENMVKKLKGLGYSNADFFVFDGSQYFTVSAARSQRRSAAVNISNELKQRGIDSYVHTKQ